MLPHILVVEDEPAIAEMICLNLRHSGFTADWADDAAKACAAVDKALPDLILLDWMLPERSGFALVQSWRKNSYTQGVPIIMLTARSEEGDKISGLEAGADDYMTKPFSTQELVARIRAVLRRRAPEKAGQKLEHGALQLDSMEHKVRFQEQDIKLGPTEFKLLQYLLTHKNRVHSREQLLDKVWGQHVYIESRTVDVHIKRLREALGEAGVYIETVRGVGYKFDANRA